MLLGRRARHARFMPGNLAFPGGKLEPEDEPERARRLRALRLARGSARKPGSTFRLGMARGGERTTPPLYPVRFRTLFFVAELARRCDRSRRRLRRPRRSKTLRFADPRAVLADWESGRALVPPPLLPILRAHAEAPRAGEPSRSRRDASPRVNARGSREPADRVRPRHLGASREDAHAPAGVVHERLDAGRTPLRRDRPGKRRARRERAPASPVIAKRVARSGDAVDAVVLTHHHRDHVSGAAPIAAALGVPVLAHAGNARAGSPRSRRRRDARPERRRHARPRRHDASRDPHARPRAGHLAFFDAARRVLIAGDLVSGPLDDPRRLRATATWTPTSTRFGASSALDPKMVLPSHGPPLPGKALAATIAHRDEQAGIVAALLADGRGRSDLATIAAAAYAGAAGLPRVSCGSCRARAHLERLVPKRPVGEERGPATASSSSGRASGRHQGIRTSMLS